MASDVEDLTFGVYRYEPDGNQVTGIINGDRRTKLAGADLAQPCVKEGQSPLYSPQFMREQPLSMAQGA